MRKQVILPGTRRSAFGGNRPAWLIIQWALGSGNGACCRAASAGKRPPSSPSHSMVSHEESEREERRGNERREEKRREEKRRAEGRSGRLKIITG